MSTSPVDYWPRLTRFYGLQPRTLARMPYALLQVYLEQLDALQAEEQLAYMQAADTPHLEKGERARLYRAMQRMAELEPPAPAVINPLEPSGVNTLAGFGVKVVMEDA